MYTIHFWKYSLWGLQLQKLDNKLHIKLIKAYTKKKIDIKSLKN